MAKTKPVINVAFVGHVDHGKSTTIGHLMFQAGNLSQQNLDKLKEEAKKQGKVGFLSRPSDVFLYRSFKERFGGRRRLDKKYSS